MGPNRAIERIWLTLRFPRNSNFRFPLRSNSFGLHLPGGRVFSCGTLETVLVSVYYVVTLSSHKRITPHVIAKLKVGHGFGLSKPAPPFCAPVLVCIREGIAPLLRCFARTRRVSGCGGVPSPFSPLLLVRLFF